MPKNSENPSKTKKFFIGPIVGTTGFLALTLQAIWYALVSFFTGQWIKRQQRGQKKEQPQEQKKEEKEEMDNGWVDPLKSRKRKS